MPEHERPACSTTAQAAHGRRRAATMRAPTAPATSSGREAPPPRSIPKWPVWASWLSAALPSAEREGEAAEQ